MTEPVGCCDFCDRKVAVDSLTTVGGIADQCPSCATEEPTPPSITVPRAEWDRVQRRVQAQRRELKALNRALERECATLRLKVQKQRDEIDRLTRMYLHANTLSGALAQVDADVRALHCADEYGLCVVCRVEVVDEPCGTVRALSPDPVAYLREVHVRHPRRSCCRECGGVWPCAVVRVLDQGAA